MDWLDILKTAGITSAVLLSVVGFLGTKLLAHWFQKESKRFELDLALKHNEKLEAIRTENAQVLEGVRAEKSFELDAVRTENARVLEGVRAENAEKLEGVRSEYAKVLEGVRAEKTVELETIRAEKTKELDAIRAGLTTLQQQRTKQYEMLQGERLKAIVGVYENILEFENAYMRFASPIVMGATKPNDRVEDLDNAVKNLANVMKKNRIYFSEMVCNDLELMLSSTVDICWDIEHNKEVIQGIVEYDEKRKYLDRNIELLKQLRTAAGQTIPAARQRIEQHFRELIGVDSPDTNCAE